MLTHRKRGGRGGEKSQARAFGLPSWFVLALAGVLLWGAAPVAAVDLPVPTSCQIDVACAANKMVNGECPDDQPGQKDLTQFCVDDGGVVPDQDCTGGFCSVTGDVCAAAADCPQVYELHSLWNWDITALSGANTGDACTLYDTNTNGFADIAVCVTIRDGGATVELGAVRLFTCGDTRVDRCPGSTQIAGNECVGGDNDGVSCSLESDCSAGGGVCIPGPTLNTSCEVSQQDTNPFDTTFDTEALCWVDLNDFGAPGATADLLDACSYPSEQPGSDPSDCVITGCTMDSQCDDSDACTSDVCDTNTGNCVNTDITASCDDSSACTADSCDPATGCVNTDISASCVDGNACTADSCDPAVGCVNTDISASCDDTDACTADSCDPASGCVNTRYHCVLRRH